MTGALTVTPRTGRTLAALFSGVVALIYLPILVMAVFSFSSGRFQTLPFREATTDWYARIAADDAYAEAAATSLILAFVVSIAATLIAFAAAYALANARIRGKQAILALLLSPLAVPLVLIGIGLRLYATTTGFPLGYPSVAIGQTIYVLPLAVLNLQTRIAQLPKSHEEAAWSLGATRLRGIIDVVLPSCAAALIATLILTFTFAFDEFAIAYFLTTFEITLPIKIWTTLVTGYDPTINALGTLVFGFSVLLGITAQLLLSRKGRAA